MGRPQSPRPPGFTGHPRRYTLDGEMADLRRQFSLEYLSTSTGAAARGAEELNRAIVLFSQPILAELRAAPGRSMEVHELVMKLRAKKVDVGSFDEFLGVINKLADLNFIEIVVRDPLLANHLIKMADAVP